MMYCLYHIMNCGGLYTVCTCERRLRVLVDEMVFSHLPHPPARENTNKAQDYEYGVCASIILTMVTPSSINLLNLFSYLSFVCSN